MENRELIIGYLLACVLFLFVYATGAKAQSNTCSNGDMVVINTGGTKNNQCQAVSKTSINAGWWGSVGLSASTTYYYSNASYDGPTGTDNNFTQLICPVTGTIEAFYVLIYVGGTQSSSETATITLRVNSVDTSSVITTSFNFSNSSMLSDTTHTAAVTAGDKLQIKIVTPAWGTAPTGVRLQWAIRIKP